MSFNASTNTDVYKKEDRVEFNLIPGDTRSVTKGTIKSTLDNDGNYVIQPDGVSASETKVIHKSKIIKKL